VSVGTGVRGTFVTWGTPASVGSATAVLRPGSVAAGTCRVLVAKTLGSGTSLSEQAREAAVRAPAMRESIVLRERITGTFNWDDRPMRTDEGRKTNDEGGTTDDRPPTTENLIRR
jgi:hypothetical protein